MYRGRYINLDRNTQRRALIEETLRRCGVAERYQRFAAVDGAAAAATHPTRLSHGELGVWLSHERIVSEHQNAAASASAADAADAHLHIVEDDVLFPDAAATLFDHLLRRADAELDQWDILYTDIAPAIETKALLALAEHTLTYPQTRRIGFVPL